MFVGVILIILNVRDLNNVNNIICCNYFILSYKYIMCLESRWYISRMIIFFFVFYIIVIVGDGNKIERENF